MKREDWYMNAIYMHVQDPSTLDTSIDPWCGRRMGSERETTTLQSLIVSEPQNAGNKLCLYCTRWEEKPTEYLVFTINLDKSTKYCGRDLYLKWNQEKEEIAHHFDKH